jgi:hypothetical protein
MMPFCAARLSQGHLAEEAEAALLRLFRGMKDLGNPTTTGVIISHRKRE